MKRDAIEEAPAWVTVHQTHSMVGEEVGPSPKISVSWLAYATKSAPSRVWAPSK